MALSGFLKPRISVGRFYVVSTSVMQHRRACRAIDITNAPNSVQRPEFAAILQRAFYTVSSNPIRRLVSSPIVLVAYFRLDHGFVNQ
jgi:hypothetical protein